MTDSLFQKRIAQPLDTFVRLSPEQRTAMIRAAVSDLNVFFDDGVALGERDAPPRPLALSRLDGIAVDLANGVAIVGAGVRLRVLHQVLAERGKALTVYPSNLGGTLAGWFMTGGIGLNAFASGRALDMVRAADVVLVSGEHLRFHDDGRLDVPGEGHHRRALTAEQSAEWFRDRGLAPVTLAELAGSEGTFGMLTHLTV